MGINLTSLATGALGAAAAYKMGSDRRERDKKFDDKMLAVYDKMAGGPGASKDSAQTAPKDPAAPAPAPVVEVKPEVPEQNDANGGIVRAAAPMPQHYDRMGWQRQSFKKNAQSETDVFGQPVVAVTRIK